MKSTYCESVPYLGLELGEVSLLWTIDTLFLVAAGLKGIVVE
jgi:hypothetical protein